MIVLDRAASKRTKDENGYLIIKDNPIAASGVFEYLKSELFDGGDDVIVKVYRDFDDLKKIKDSFANKPIVHNHSWVGEERNNVDGAIGSEVRANESDGMLYADLIIYNPELVERIENGDEVELSPGYTGDIVEEKGVYDSQSYEYRQVLDYCNHLAVVKNGRAGKDLRIQDQKPQGEIEMQKNVVQKFIDVLMKIRDEEVEPTEMRSEGTGEPKPKTEDSPLDDIAAIMADESKSETEKLQAISELVSKKTEDEDVVAKVEPDGDEGEPTAEAIGELIGEIVEKKIGEFTDAQSKKAKRITDAYTKVSDAIGSTFNYSGMDENGIYKFGYEALSGNELAEGMDAQTAFMMSTSAKRGAFVDNAPQKQKEESAIMSALSKY